MLAERVGFEPTCRLPDNTLSRRARYDHFGTSPQRASKPEGLRYVRVFRAKPTLYYTAPRGAVVKTH